MAVVSKPLYRIGTRKSALATIQSLSVMEFLRGCGIYCELISIESAGDLDRNSALYEIESEGPGIFTKQLERALMEDQIDIAVHSLKDLPTKTPPGLTVAALPKRLDSEDCLIVRPENRESGKLLEIRAHLRVGTSSLRREAELLALRPDLEVIPIRGNVPTRIEAVRQRKVDAVILAKAGLSRLQPDLAEVTMIELPLDQFVSAPGQGALAVQTRSVISEELRLALQKLHDPVTERETSVERAILRELHGGCTLPLGVRCLVEVNNALKLRVFLGVARDRKKEPHAWISFHRFDILESSEETLLPKTVGYLRDLLDGR